jgi:hypothetical protein
MSTDIPATAPTRTDDETKTESKYDYYDTFNYVVYERFSDQICKNCWRLVRTELDAPTEEWRDGRERRLGKVRDPNPIDGEPTAHYRGRESTKAITGTRPRVDSNTTRSWNASWCECGLNLKDMHECARPDDVSFENGPHLLSDEIDGHFENEMSTHIGLVDRASDYAENFATTYHTLRQSAPDEDLPWFNPELFKCLFLTRLNPFGEDVRVNHSLRASFGAAVVADLDTWLYAWSASGEISARLRMLGERCDELAQLMKECPQCDPENGCEAHKSEATEEITSLVSELTADSWLSTGPDDDLSTPAVLRPIVGSVLADTLD